VVAVTGAGAGGAGSKIFTAASFLKSSSKSRVASPCFKRFKWDMISFFTSSSLRFFAASFAFTFKK
jgi:hypothetical protein